MSTRTASTDDHSRFVWLLHSTMRSIKSTEIKMVCRSRLYIARPQSLTNVRKSTQLPTFLSYWRLATGGLTANRQISTWKISILHGAIQDSPRGDESFPPKFHLIPPKFYFFSTWRIFFFHVDISKSPRGDFFVPMRMGQIRPISMGRLFRTIYHITYVA